MQLVSLHTLKDLFPKDSWLWEGLHTIYDILQDQTVLLITEDLVLKNLDLDAPEKSFSAIPKGKSIYQILCTGNLKAKNIYNSDTEGSCGLMVYGDLRCQNIVIGGQQVYVGGNLVASQCFWGNHHHGTLVVKGNVYTGLFLTTDGYQAIEENIQLYKGGTFLKETYGGAYDEELIENLFLPACLIHANEREEYPYTWNHFLDRKKIIRRLNQHLPLLKNYPITPQPEQPAIEKIFTPVPETINTQKEWEVQLPNFLKLYECCLLEEDNIMGFDAHGWEFVVHTAYENDPDIFMITARNADEKFVISFTLEKREESRYDTSVYLLNTAIDDGVYPLGKLDIAPFYLKMIRDVWNVLLYHAERGIYFFKQYLEEVKPKDITYFSTLPIILEKYNDWDDSDKNGYWHGDFYYAFRIPDEKWGAAELKICKEIHTRAEDDFDCRAYRIQNDDIDQPKRVQLYYNFSQSERIEGRYKDYSGTRVYFFDDELYAEALQWYRRAKKIIPKENRNYLEERIDDEIDDYPT